MSFVTEAKQFHNPKKFRNNFCGLKDLSESKYSRVQVNQNKKVSSYIPTLKEKPLSKKGRTWEWILPLFSSQARQKNLVRFIGNFIEKNKDLLSCDDLEGEEKIEALQSEMDTLNTLAEFYRKYQNYPEYRIIQTQLEVVQSKMMEVSLDLDQNIANEKKEIADLKETYKGKLAEVEQEQKKVEKSAKKEIEDLKKQGEEWERLIAAPEDIFEKVLKKEKEENIKLAKEKINKFQAKIEELTPIKERLERKVKQKEDKYKDLKNANATKKVPASKPFGVSRAMQKKACGEIMKDDEADIVFISSEKDENKRERVFAHTCVVENILEKLPASQEKMVIDGKERTVYHIGIKKKELKILKEACYQTYPKFKATFKRWHKLYSFADHFEIEWMKSNLKKTLENDFLQFIYAKDMPRVRNIFYFLNHRDHFQIVDEKIYEEIFKQVSLALFKIQDIALYKGFAELSKETLLQTLHVTLHEDYMFKTDFELCNLLCQWALKKSEKEGEEAFNLLFEKEEDSYSLWDHVRFDKISEKDFKKIYKRYPEIISRFKDSTYESAKDAYQDLCEASRELLTQVDSPRYADKFWEVISNTEDLLVVQFSASLEDLEFGQAFRLPGLNFPKYGYYKVSGGILFDQENLSQTDDDQEKEKEKESVGYSLKVYTDLNGSRGPKCEFTITTGTKEKKLEAELGKEVTLSDSPWTLDQMKECSEESQFKLSLTLQKAGRNAHAG